MEVLISNWVNGDSFRYEPGRNHKYIVGYGSGASQGDGNGNGTGCGYGDRFGSGYAVGDGGEFGRSYYACSHGSAVGCSDSDGTCDCGAGDGEGCQRGYRWDTGWGNGSGSEKIVKVNGHTVYYIDDVPTVITKIFGNYAKGFMVGKDYQLTHCYVAKDVGTNLFAHGETLHSAVYALDEKVYRNIPVSERITDFLEKFKSDKKYSGNEFFRWHNLLTGSCLMGRYKFIKDHCLDLNAEYTVREFIDIVDGHYGHDIIKKLKPYYEEDENV